MMRSQALRLTWAWLLLALVPALAGGAPDEDTAKDGSRVILRSRETPLKVGSKVVSRGDTHWVYRVDRADGPWLWVVAEGARGWVRATDVIPFEQAIDHFTTVLRTQPQSAS